MKRCSRNLVLLFLATTVVTAVIIHLLDREDQLPLHDGEVALNVLVATSMYDALALTGLAVLVRFLRRDKDAVGRLGVVTLGFVVMATVRHPAGGQWPGPAFLVPAVLWDAARAVGVAFSIAYLAHALMARYLPSTLLRVRDIRPLVYKGSPATKKRLRHARRSRWMFDLADRPYIDTTRLRLGTREGTGFDGPSWAEASFWSAIVILALSIYIEAYPRVNETFDLVLTGVLSGYLLCIVPVLMLPIYPVEELGAEIPVEDGVYRLADGFRHTSYRWTKISFLPIIAVGLLFRVMSWEDIVSLVQALLISVPGAVITCLVYLDHFRRRTVAEVHQGIREREAREREQFGEEPWAKGSLMDGVETVRTDV